MDRLFQIAIVTAIAVPFGILLGLGAVCVFNKMPAKWLCDYGEEPSAELADKNNKRLKEYPAKLILPAIFAAAGVYMCNIDYVFGFAALIELWLLFMIALSDGKYMIIPDQFVVFLALFAFPLSVYRESVKDMILGALLGLSVMLAVALIGRLIFRQEALGFGDVKLMAAIGLTAGLYGTACILVVTSILSAAYFAFGMIRGTIKKGDFKPLGPFIAVSCGLYLVVSAAII